MSDTNLITPKSQTQELNLKEVSTPSTPASGLKKLYAKADGKVYTLDSSGTEVEVGSGSGSGINYIANPGAETDTTGWATYNDTGLGSPDDTVPENGTGGVANITWTRNTSSPLRGVGDFVLTKDTANRQGEGSSYAFTIDNADAGKELDITFDYKTSANYASGDLRVYVYDVTGTTLITPILQGQADPELTASTNIAPATFRFHSNSGSTSYRLIFHVASTNATAYTVNVDNVRVGPKSFTSVPIVTEPVTTTLTGSWVSGNETYTSSTWREGKFLHCKFTIDLSGAPTATALTLTIPDGLTIDTSISGYAVGNDNVPDSILSVVDPGVETVPGFFLIASSTTVEARYFSKAAAADKNNALQVTSTAPVTLANGDYVHGYFKVPISGWTAGAVMSTTEIQNQVGKTKYEQDTGQNITTATPEIIDFETKIWDDNNAVTTGASWKWTAWKPGTVVIKCKMLFAATTNWDASEVAYIRVYKNGIADNFIDYVLSQTTGVSYNMGLNGTAEIDVVEGDYIDIRIYQSTGSDLSTNGDPDQNWVTIDYKSDFTTYGVYGVNEHIESKLTTISNYTITAGQYGDLTNITLTPGIWDITAQILWYSNGAVTTDNVAIGVSTTSGNSTSGLENGNNWMLTKKDQTNGAYDSIIIGSYKVQVTDTDVYYLKASAATSITNLQVAYRISARRIQ